MKKVTKKLIAKEIFKVTKRLKRFPTRREYRKYGKISSHQIEDLLGSWNYIRSLKMLKMIIK